MSEIEESSATARVHIVGTKNSGKTTLVCELVQEITKRGFSVATIKHTHHSHELDTPGKDSWQHRNAGATAVGILAAEMTAVFFPEQRLDNEADRYRRLAAAFQDCDVILVEGDLQTSAPKLEVWRSCVSQAPYAESTPDISTVISDDSVKLNQQRELQVLKRSDVGKIADVVLSLAGRSPD